MPDRTISHTSRPLSYIPATARFSPRTQRSGASKQIQTLQTNAPSLANPRPPPFLRRAAIESFRRNNTNPAAQYPRHAVESFPGNANDSIPVRPARSELKAHPPLSWLRRNYRTDTVLHNE